MSKEQTDRLISPVGRVWFPPHLLTPRVNKKKPEQEPKFGLTIAFTPSTFDTLDKKLWEAMIAAANAKAVGTFKLTIPNFTDAMKKPWHKGTEKKEFGMTENEVYMNCTSKFQPSIAGPDAKTVKDPLPTYVYPGCYVRISTAPYSFNNEGKGVAFGVFNVMFVRDGEPLKTGIEAEEDFSDYATATATGGAPLTDADLGI